MRAVVNRGNSGAPMARRTVLVSVVGGHGAKCALRDTSGLGPASPEASKMNTAAPLPPESN